MSTTALPMVRWLLNDLMVKYGITNTDLAKRLNRIDTAIYRLKRKPELPAIGGSELERIAKAMTDILGDRGLNVTITAKDLIGFED